MATYEEQYEIQKKDPTQGGYSVGGEVIDVSSQVTPIDTLQPSPTNVQVQQTGLSKVGTSAIGPDGKPIYDVFAGQEHIQDPSDPRLKGIDIVGLPTGQAPSGFKSKFEQGFNQYNKETDGKGEGSASIVNRYAPSGRNDLSSAFMQTDEFMGGLFKSFQDFINPANQRKSLTETYNKMLKDSGVEAIDMELINTKNIIEGSEDDLRMEITKAGGFTTNSQVLALTNARNKQLIKNYNTLLDTRNSKEKYLQTAIGLEQQDRQAADQRFESMFNMGMQIADYGQKMNQNAISGIERMANTIGWDGILEATQGDVYAQSLIEKTYGLPNGGLAKAAQQATLARAQAQEQQNLDLEEQRL